MAKKDIDFDFKEFVKQLKEDSIKESVVIDTKKERKYFLIVCEGEKTEPLYFESFKNLLPKNLLDTVEIIGEGDNTLNIVNRAVELREKRRKNPVLPDFDEVWAVFDKDDFPNQNFDNAISKARIKDINCAYSNQSFELWYVLHFDYLQSCIHRDDYIDILTKRLGFKYKKNDRKVIDFINKNCEVKVAIDRAKRLEDYHILNKSTPSESCPTTIVYRLVENLLEYCE